MWPAAVRRLEQRPAKLNKSSRREDDDRDVESKGHEAEGESEAEESAHVPAMHANSYDEKPSDTYDNPSEEDTPPRRKPSDEAIEQVTKEVQHALAWHRVSRHAGHIDEAITFPDSCQPTSGTGFRSTRAMSLATHSSYVGAWASATSKNQGRMKQPTIDT